MTHWRRLTFRLAALAAAFAVIGQAGPARAEDKSGVSPAHVKLPRGPGSLEGLGENVEPNLAMGLMSYGIPIEVPGGYPGLGPSLRLVYSSGNAASVVGIGWSLAAPSIERMTSQRLPSYDLDDRFAAGGSDELVRVDESENAYRARFEGGFVRYTWEDAGDGREGY
ncbi:MAG TPA: SpvB/TcaC N-terminal domain-containing protein, partial [Polyangiaceae bacterium]